MAVSELVPTRRRDEVDEMTPEERDRLTRLEEQYDALNNSVNERFALAHERNNKIQLDYVHYEERLHKQEALASDFKVAARITDGLDWERRLRLLEEASIRNQATSRSDKAWWIAVSGLLGAFLTALFEKFFGK